MKLYLVNTDPNSYYITNIEEKDNSYWDEFVKINKTKHHFIKNKHVTYSVDEYGKKSPILYNVDELDMDNGYGNNSITDQFIKWYRKVESRNTKINQLLES